MIKLEKRLVVGKSVRKVFAFLGDLANLPQFDQQVIRMNRVSDESIGPGTRYREIGRPLGWRTEMTVEIEEYVPDKKITFRREGAGFSQIITWEFQPAFGSTRVSVTFEHQPKKSTFMASEPVDALILKESLEARVSNLKRILESDLPVSG